MKPTLITITRFGEAIVRIVPLFTEDTVPPLDFDSKSIRKLYKDDNTVVSISSREEYSEDPADPSTYFDKCTVLFGTGRTGEYLGIFKSKEDAFFWIRNVQATYDYVFSIRNPDDSAESGFRHQDGRIEMK